MRLRNFKRSMSFGERWVLVFTGEGGGEVGDEEGGRIWGCLVFWSDCLGFWVGCFEGETMKEVGDFWVMGLDG